MFLLRRCFGACSLKVRFRIICILTLEGEKGIGRNTRAGGCNVSSHCSLSEDYGTASLEERCG